VRIYHEPDHRSRIELPIIPTEARRLTPPEKAS